MTERPPPPPEKEKTSLWPLRLRKGSSTHPAVEAEAKLEEALAALKAAKDENDAMYREFFSDDDDSGEGTA
jgi:hypothetical protein